MSTHSSAVASPVLRAELARLARFCVVGALEHR